MSDNQQSLQLGADLPEEIDIQGIDLSDYQPLAGPPPTSGSAEEFTSWAVAVANRIGAGYFARPWHCPPIFEATVPLLRPTGGVREPDQAAVQVLEELLRGRTSERDPNVPDPVCIPPETIASMLLLRTHHDPVALRPEWVIEALQDAFAHRRFLDGNGPPLSEVRAARRLSRGDDAGTEGEEFITDSSTDPSLGARRGPAAALASAALDEGSASFPEVDVIMG